MNVYKKCFDSIIIKEEPLNWLNLNIKVKQFSKYDLYKKNINASKKKLRESLIKKTTYFQNVKYGDFKKKINKLNKKNFVILPDSNFNIGFNIIFTIIVIINNLFIPYYIAFYNNENWVLIIFEIIQEIFFIIDILLGFITGYFDKKDNIIVDYKKIIYNYMINWFIIDLITCFPYQIFYYFLYIKISYSSYKLFQFLNILRFLKIFKLVKKRKYYFKIFEKIKQKKKILNKLLYSYFILILNFHIINCLWFFIFYKKSININESNFKYYIISSYWTIQTVFTVGYGDYNPNSNESYLLFIIFMFLGTFIYTYSISLISNTFSNDNNTHFEKQKLNSKFKNLIKEFKFIENEKITKKIQKFIKNLSYINITLEEVTKDLNKKLKKQLFHIISLSKFNGVEYILSQDKEFITKIFKYLKEIRFKKNDIIILEDDFVNEIYFIKKGNIEVSIKNRKENTVLKVINEGFIGDIENLFYKNSSKFTYKCLSSTIVFMLNINDFYKIFIKKFPEIGEDFLDISLKKKIEIKKIMQSKRIYSKNNLKTQKLSLLNFNKKPDSEYIKKFNQIEHLTDISIKINKIIKVKI